MAHSNITLETLSSEEGPSAAPASSVVSVCGAMALGGLDVATPGASAESSAPLSSGESPVVERRARPSRLEGLSCRIQAMFRPASSQIEEFLDEQYRATRVAIRGAMMVGSSVFILRGIMDWKNGVAAPQIEHELLLRVIGSVVMLGLVFAFKKNVTPERGQSIMSAFVFALTCGLVGAVLLNDVRGPYTLFPLVFLFLMGTALWLRTSHLIWTMSLAVVPIIMLMFSGAMTKPDIQAYSFYIFNAFLLGALLRHGRLKTAYEAFLLRKHLAAQAHKDPLTGALNRAGWDNQIALQKRSSKGRASILYVDLDKFKLVNDTYGHPVGDKLIQNTVERVRSILRGSDVLARFGGEEFVVFLPGCAVKEAALIAERIRALVESCCEPVPATVSIGVSECGPGESIEEAVQRADTALLQSKQTGRNRVTVL